MMGQGCHQPLAATSPHLHPQTQSLVSTGWPGPTPTKPLILPHSPTSSFPLTQGPQGIWKMERDCPGNTVETSQGRVGKRGQSPGLGARETGLALQPRCRGALRSTDIGLAVLCCQGLRLPWPTLAFHIGSILQMGTLRLTTGRFLLKVTKKVSHRAPAKAAQRCSAWPASLSCLTFSLITGGDLPFPSGACCRAVPCLPGLARSCSNTGGLSCRAWRVQTCSSPFQVGAIPEILPTQTGLGALWEFTYMSVCKYAPVICPFTGTPRGST